MGKRSKVRMKPKVKRMTGNTIQGPYSDQFIAANAPSTSLVELRRQENILTEAENKLKARMQFMQHISRNGITVKDLEENYQCGYDNARKDLTRMTMQFFYSAIAIASHRLYGFGETRICRLLDAVQEIMCEEITTVDIRARCKEETGVDIIENDYDN